MGMGMNMGKDFENPMNIDVDMRMTFKNEYMCGYNSTRSVSVRRSSPPLYAYNT